MTEKTNLQALGSTAVLGVGSTRMHPHDNKFHAGNGDDGKHYWLTPPELPEFTGWRLYRPSGGMTG